MKTTLSILAALILIGCALVLYRCEGPALNEQEPVLTITISAAPRG